MLEYKKVSIIIPTYNCENYIERCLDSVCNQTYKNLEIIIIDDGSTDNTHNIIKIREKKDSRIKVILKGNEGVSKTRNLGVKISKGELITFIDSDDYYELNAIEILVENMEKFNADISICTFNVIEDNIISYTNNIKNNPKIFNSDQVIKKIFLDDDIKGFLWNKMFKSEIFKTLNIPEHLDVCEDLYCICEILREERKIVYTPTALYNYYMNVNSVTHNYSKLIDKKLNWKYTEVYKDIEVMFQNDTELVNYVKIGRLFITQLGVLDLVREKKYSRTVSKLKKDMIISSLDYLKSELTTTKSKLKYIWTIINAKSQIKFIEIKNRKRR